MHPINPIATALHIRPLQQQAFLVPCSQWCWKDRAHCTARKKAGSQHHWCFGKLGSTGPPTWVPLIQQLEANQLQRQVNKRIARELHILHQSSAATVTIPKLSHKELRFLTTSYPSRSSLIGTITLAHPAVLSSGITPWERLDITCVHSALSLTLSQQVTWKGNFS